MKYVMLTGHRKSGTTMLHRLFDGHPGLNVYPVDLSLLYAFYPCWLTNTLTEAEIKERISLVIKKSTEQIVGKAISNAIQEFNSTDFINTVWQVYKPGELNRPSAIVEAIGKSYCRYAELDTDKPFLFKETSQAVNFRGFVEDGVDLKMIQIVRDPRDNYAAIKDGVSTYYKKMGEDERESLASVLNRAKLDLEVAKLESSVEGKDFYTTRFEDLVTTTHVIIDDIAKKIGIDWADVLLDPTDLGSPFTGNNHMGQKFNGVSSSNLGRWRERITESEACVIEAWMGDVMRFWGYKLEYDTDSHLRALAEFYAWYNCRYFYRDSFSV